MMKTKAICVIPIADIAEDDALLFLWATGACLPDAVEVGRAWGFNWATVAFVWDKQTAVAGFYTMSTCEYCFCFKRGKIPQPRGPRNIRQLVSCKVGRHSVKPAIIRNLIVEMFPHHRRIELFARGQFQGWDTWGNEVDTYIEPSRPRQTIQVHPPQQQMLFSQDF